MLSYNVLFEKNSECHWFSVEAKILAKNKKTVSHFYLI